MSNIIEQFLQGMRQTTWLEYIAVFSGIASVYFSRLENIYVYPVGLISTVIYIWLSIKGSLFGEASVNLYYTIMSIYGWVLWARRNEQQEKVVVITFSNRKEWTQQILFCAAFYIAIYFSLIYLKQQFNSHPIPWADAFASSTAYTGMWLMAKKKAESWWWWIATDAASVPLYFVKGFVFSSVYYFVLLAMAFWGLFEWIKRANKVSVMKQEKQPDVLLS